MTYRDALRIAFVSFGTSWRLLPRHGREVVEHLGGAVGLLAVMLLVLLGPVLALFAPLIAFAVLKADRDEQRAIAEFERKVDKHYGARRQRVDR